MFIFYVLSFVIALLYGFLESLNHERDEITQEVKVLSLDVSIEFRVINTVKNYK